MKSSKLKLFWIIFILNICFCRQKTIKDSWEALISKDKEYIHASHHINNILRNNSLPISDEEENLLKDLNIKVINNELKVLIPSVMESIYETEHFNIHYDLSASSNNAIDEEDLNNNGIPDYAENMGMIFEYVHSYFKDSLNYDLIFHNNQNSNIEKYNIFINDLPSNYFALTYTTSFINESNTSCGSYIKMRNNYNGSTFQNLSEEENIKVTAAHEFFHAIQFSYNCYERFWLMEATAVWSEDKIYDNINDHYRYMPSWFQNSSKTIDDESTHMYGSFIFFQYLEEHLGGPDLIKSIWENSRYAANSVNDISFASINSALEEVGSSFNSAINNMRIANRIMSSHPNAYPFTYEEADTYPVSGPLEIAQLSFENNIVNYTQNAIYKNAANYLKIDLLAPAKIKINVDNGFEEDIFSAVILKYQNGENYTIKTGNDLNIDPGTKIEWASLLINTQSQNQNSWSYSVSISPGKTEDFNVYNAYPNPYISQNNKFETKLISPVTQNIKINIYNILGQTIINKDLLLLESEEKSFEWNLKNRHGKKVSSGIYFIEIKGENKRLVKKVTLLN